MHTPQTAWLSGVFQALPAAVLALDPTGRVLGMNPRAERSLGLAPAEVEGRLLGEVAHRLPASIVCALQRLLSGRSEAEEGEVVAGGERLRYSAAWADDRSAGLFVILGGHSPTAGDESSSFLAIASHELKTPLTAIKGGTQLLQRRIGRNAEHLGERDAQLLGMVVGQVDKLNGMVDGLLEASRLSSGRIELRCEPCDLRRVLQEVACVADADAPSNPVLLRLAPEPVLVLCDRRRVGQALEALMANAIAASEPGQRVQVRLSAADGRARIAVVDEGRGVSPEDQPHILERFYRGRGSEKGLGLGLYVASELVRRHGGELTFDSEPGRGSTFRIDLPLAREP